MRRRMCLCPCHYGKPVPTSKRIVSKEPICPPIKTDRGDYYYERTRYGDGSQQVALRRVGSKVSVAVSVWDVGEPVSLLMASAPGVAWFNVGLPWTDDEAYALGT